MGEKRWVVISPFWIGLCALTLGLAWWMFLWAPQKEYFPIDAVRVEGDYSHLSRKDLYQVVRPYLSQGFFGLAMADMKVSLQALPWVAEVSIKRLWPNQVVVRITERKAVAKWGEVSLLSDKGIVFTPDQGLFQGDGPRITGPDDSMAPYLLSQWQVMRRILAPLGLDIVTLDLSHRRAWDVGLSNGVSVLLGKGDALTRLQRLVKIYPRLLGTRADGALPVRIDMRYANGLAVLWSGG